MLYGEIEVGDILELKTFGSQKAKLLITAAGEIVKYGAKKGDDKKIIPAFYVRSLSAFDDDPQMVEASYLRQHCTRAAAEPLPSSGDEATAAANPDDITYETGEPAVEYDEYSQGEAPDDSQVDSRASSSDDYRNRQENAPPPRKHLPLKQLTPRR